MSIRDWVISPRLPPDRSILFGLALKVLTACLLAPVLATILPIPLVMWDIVPIRYAFSAGLVMTFLFYLGLFMKWNFHPTAAMEVALGPIFFVAVFTLSSRWMWAGLLFGLFVSLRPMTYGPETEGWWPAHHKRQQTLKTRELKGRREK